MFEYSFAINSEHYDPQNFEPFFDEIEDKDNSRISSCFPITYPYAKVISDQVNVCPYFDFITLNPYSFKHQTLDEILNFIDCNKLGFVDFSIKTPSKHWSGTAIASIYHESLSKPSWDLHQM